MSLSSLSLLLDVLPLGCRWDIARVDHPTQMKWIRERDGGVASPRLHPCRRSPSLAPEKDDNQLAQESMESRGR